MNDKQQLLSNIDKRFKTTMIGSLSNFEKGFSHLWEGEGDEDRKTYYYELWQDIRDEVLNNGNHQARSATKELKSFLYPNQVTQRYNFKFNDKGDDSYGN